MKRILTFFVATIMSVVSYAQYNTGDISIEESNVYFGARLGIDFSRLNGDISSSSSRTGLIMGAVVGIRISESTPICIESGLYYTERGAQRKLENNNKERISLSYLELPILIKYGFDLGNEMAILPYVGPYFSLGVGGRIKDNTSNVYSFSDVFNRPDMGMKFGCGFEYNHLYLEMGYQLGIANIAQESLSTIHGNAWFINFGFNI